MATITQLVVYPVKSCAGIALDAVRTSETGFEHDREWMVVDAAGVFVSQREQPRLALVRPVLADGALRLEAPGMAPLSLRATTAGATRSVELWGERLSSCEAPREADAWFSEYLGGAHRLVGRDPAFHRKGGVQYPSRDEAPTSFPDNYGVLVVSQASLRDLNARLPEPVPMNRFRPNIVVDGVEAYEEDHFVEARAGGVGLRFIDLCYRCNLTTIDQATAEFGAEPLLTLGRYRANATGVKFGSYAAVTCTPGHVLRVSDALDATLDY